MHGSLCVDTCKLSVCVQGTAHFKHGLRLQAQTQERIRRMQQQAQALTASQLASYTRCSQYVFLLAICEESSWELCCHAYHVDWSNLAG